MLNVKMIVHTQKYSKNLVFENAANHLIILYVNRFTPTC